MHSRLDLLRQVPLFAGIDDEGLAAIDGAIEEIQVLAGTAITHEGRVETWFFILVSGSVRVERGGRTVNMLGPGAFFGEIALLDGGPRTASAVEETETLLLTMQHQRFHELVAASPQIRGAVLEAVGTYLRRLDGEATT